MIRTAQRSHPSGSHSDRALPGAGRPAPEPGESNPSWLEPGWPFDGELRVPTGQSQEVAFEAEDLTDLRRFVLRWASDEALEDGLAQEFVLAIHEIATNSVRHGGGRGRLMVWREGETLLCEVRDNGQISNPMLGEVQPGPQASCSRGLWIANQLCDLVQIRSSAAGSQVRMHKHLR